MRGVGRIGALRLGGDESDPMFADALTIGPSVHHSFITPDTKERHEKSDVAVSAQATQPQHLSTEGSRERPPT